MCLTIPGKVVKVKNNKAAVLMPRGIRQINISAIPHIETGDWVLVQANLALKKIKACEAKEILKLFN